MASAVQGGCYEAVEAWGEQDSNCGGEYCDQRACRYSLAELSAAVQQIWSGVHSPGHEGFETVAFGNSGTCFACPRRRGTIAGEPDMKPRRVKAAPKSHALH